MAKFVWNHDKTVKINMNRVDSIDIDNDNKEGSKFYVKAYYPDGTWVTIKDFPVQGEAEAFIDSITKSPEEEIMELIPKLLSLLNIHQAGFGGTA